MIVVSNWGSYFVCNFSHLRCGILFCISTYVLYILHVRYIFVVFGSFTINKMWNSTHAAPWSTYLYNDRDRISHQVRTKQRAQEVKESWSWEEILGGCETLPRCQGVKEDSEAAGVHGHKKPKGNPKLFGGGTRGRSAEPRREPETVWDSI